ncbi:MAG: peroxiredoxin-like family protein [Pyrinomonadaceae bacterium]
MIKKPIFILLLGLSALLAGCTQGTTTEPTKRPALTVKNAETEKIVTDQDAVKNALNVGAKMPSFSLKDIGGKTVTSDELLKKGNLIVVFYRGAWCPFCNLYLQNLQKEAANIKAAGGNIVAISVEKPDKSSNVARKNELQFTVLSDPQLETARKFGIVYQLGKETDEQYKTKGLDIVTNNEMERAELPLGATYIVKQNGEIVFAYLDTDYKKRAEPDVIIENLKKINNKVN